MKLEATAVADCVETSEAASDDPCFIASGVRFGQGLLTTGERAILFEMHVVGRPVTFALPVASDSPERLKLILAHLDQATIEMSVVDAPVRN